MPVPRTRYTLATDAALARIHDALDAVLTDNGTTGREKRDILHEIAERTRTLAPPFEEEAEARGE